MKYDKEYIQSLDSNNQYENNCKLEKNGLIYSLISLLVYIFTFLPYIVIIAKGLIDAFILNKEVYGFHLFVGIFGMIVFLPTLLSSVCAILAIKKYYKIKNSKNLFRRILHALNIISLFTMGIFLFLFLFLILYITDSYWLFLIVFIAILWQFTPKLIQLLKKLFKNKHT